MPDCQRCGVSFKARRSDAKWCSDRCRKAMKRNPPDDPPDDPVPGGSLVASVVAELQRVGALDSFAGQLAITLASRLAQPNETGASSLSKELRIVMAAALEAATPPAGDQDMADDNDDLEKVRQSRESKARQAADRAGLPGVAAG